MFALMHFVTQGLWTPKDIETALWLDASDALTITESGGAVSQWDDKSGNTNHVTQVTGADQPETGSRMQNGLNVIDFDEIGRASCRERV